MDESHKHDEKQQQQNRHKVQNVWFYLFCVQNQAKLIYDVRSQDNGHPWLRSSHGREYEELLWLLKIFHFLI